MTTTPSAPNNSLSTVRFSDPHINLVSEALRGMDMTTLKAVINGARACEFTLDESNPLFQRTTKPILDYLRFTMKMERPLRDETIESFRYLSHPLTASLLINLTLAKEPTTEEVDLEMTDSFTTELSANERHRRPPTVNWKSVFSEKHLSDPLVWTVSEANVIAHREIYNTLDRLRYEMRQKTLIPYGSTKGVSSVTQDQARMNYELKDDFDGRFKGHFSARELVIEYLRDGIIPDGPAQVKQKWYPTGLKPRTYYAQGGTALMVSMHLRSFFNELADRFAYTNRFARVDVSRIAIPDPNSNNLFVYDFSNFTSNFSEQYYFLSSLADFMDGVEVYLLQSELRVIAADLGSLIRLYRDYANDYPEYYWEDKFLGYSSGVAAQCQAGFLGVYGNLMTCTVPHALVARETVETPDEIGCAGDDGIINPRSKTESIKTLLLIGEFALSKVLHGPWLYLKRRLLFNNEGQLELTELAQFPTLALLPMKYNQLSRRFPYMATKTWSTFRYALFQSIKTFLRSLPKSITKCDSAEHRATLSNCINELIRYGQLQIDNNGPRLHFPLDSGDKFGTPLPYVDAEQLTRCTRYPFFSSNRLIKRKIRKDVPSGILFDGLEEGLEYELNSSVYVNVLCQSGYLEKIDETDDDYEWVRESDLESFVQSGPEVTRYQCVRSVDGYDITTLFRRPLEKLHKRQLARNDFVEFASSKRVDSRFGRAVGGYYDHDWTEDVVVELSYDDAMEDIAYFDEESDVRIEEADFRERVSGIML